MTIWNKITLKLLFHMHFTFPLSNPWKLKVREMDCFFYSFNFEKKVLGWYDKEWRNKGRLYLCQRCPSELKLDGFDKFSALHLIFTEYFIFPDWMV